MLLEEADILAVALDSRVGKIANEWYETDDEVDSQVEQHHKEDRVGQATLNFPHVQNQVQCEQGICCVTNGRDQANDGGPSESQAEKGEERIVESVGCFAGFCEDVGFLGWDVGRDFLLDFLRLARLPRVRDLLVIWVLRMD